MNYWYLASPYSKYEHGIRQAYVEICRQAALLVRAGVKIYCPIAHTHPIAVHGEIDPLAHEIWLPLDEPFIKNASGLIVCQMQGWQESYGIKVEMQWAKEHKLDIVFMTPGQVPERFLPPTN